MAKMRLICSAFGVNQGVIGSVGAMRTLGEPGSGQKMPRDLRELFVSGGVNYVATDLWRRL